MTSSATATELSEAEITCALRAAEQAGPYWRVRVRRGEIILEQSPSLGATGPLDLFNLGVDKIPGLRAQTRNSMLNDGVKTVHAAITRSAREWKACQGFGDLSIEELQAGLAQMGLLLKQEGVR